MYNTIIGAIATVIAAVIGKSLLDITPHIINYLIAHIGLANYQKYKAIAYDIWNKIEEDTRLGTFVGDKYIQFTSLIKSKIPGITDEDINLINKAIAGEYNKMIQQLPK